MTSHPMPITNHANYMMKRLLVVLAVLSLLAASGGELRFHEKLALRMESLAR